MKFYHNLTNFTCILLSISSLLKPPTPSSVSDRQSIATLPELSNILERDASDRLIHFLESKLLLDSKKACYRRANSIQIALIRVNYDTCRAIENYKITVLILFEFSKAFDSITHKQLLKKLRTFYLLNPAITWIYTYLCERNQSMINKEGTITTWCKNSSGCLKEASLVRCSLLST